MHLKFKMIVILLSIITIILSVNGCINKDLDFHLEDKQFINLTYDEIDYQISRCDTEIKCDELIETQFNNKYITWTGTVTQVTNEKVFVTPSSKHSFLSSVILHDIDKQTKLLLSKGEKIAFSGKFFITKNINYPLTNIKMNNPSYKYIWLFLSTNSVVGIGIDITDAKIISSNLSFTPNDNSNPCLITSKPYPNGWNESQVNDYNKAIENCPCQIFGSSNIFVPTDTSKCKLLEPRIIP